MNVFLIGFMGSGKSEFGKKLARKLNRDFVDLDELIVEESGKSISEIFEKEGEKYFRDLEKKMLMRQSKQNELVVSLGGGTSCNEESWNFIASNGVSIYLKEKPEILFGRLRHERVSRPLIASLNDKDLKTFIYEKLKERETFYDRADLLYDKSQTSFSVLTVQLLSFLA